ncbi:hypothetical protein BH09SUM1_BH09SUM1_15180 [soil metagenome]
MRIIYTLLFMLAATVAGAVPNILVTGGPLDFGDAPVVAGPGNDQTITIKNTGNTSLSFTGQGYSITGTDSDSFQIDSLIVTTALAMNAQRLVDISFSPATPGAKSAFLTITTNDPDSPTVNVALSGNGLNETPVANPDGYISDEDTTLTVASLGVLANDTDDDGPTEALTAVLVTGPTHAESFVLNADGSFVYRPIANFHGSDEFTYKADDAFAQSNATSVTIIVFSVSDAPTLASISLPTALTNQNTVQVTLGTIGGPDPPSFIDVTEDSAFATKTSFSYTGQSTVTHTFSAGDGLKTVYVRARNSGGSEARSATITVDRTSPAQASGGQIAFTSGTTTVNNVDLLFSVTFTEPIKTQTLTDLRAAGVALTLNGGNVSGLSVAIDSGSGAGPYVIHVTGVSPGTGDLHVAFAQNTIFDLAGNAFNATGIFASVTLMSGIDGWMIL